MIRRGPQLPHRVTLPSAPVIAAWHLRHALGVSKAVLHLWRRDRGFPASFREGCDSFTSTDAVREWLEARGVKVARQ